MDDDFCCGCCLGLGLGYLLFSNPFAHGATLSEKSNRLEQTVISETVKTNKLNNFLIRQIENYQKNISPKIKERLATDKLCKFEPSCSKYSKQAIEKHGSIKGVLMATNRLLRCNPLSKKRGYDPVG